MRETPALGPSQAARSLRRWGHRRLTRIGSWSLVARSAPSVPTLRTWSSPSGKWTPISARHSRVAARHQSAASAVARERRVGATVSTGNLEVDRYYAENDGSEQPRQYAASCPLAVECAPEAAAPVVAEAIATGVDRLHGPRYGVRDSSRTVDELLAEAFGDARRKALRLSEAAERELGVAITVEEDRDRYETSFEEASHPLGRRPLSCPTFA